VNTERIESFEHVAGTTVLQTVSRMKRVIRDPQQVVYGRALAEVILRNTPYHRDRMTDMRRIFHGVVSRLRYLRDIAGAESLKTPKRIYHELQDTGVVVGDCDDASMFLASALKGAGYRTRFAISTTKNHPAETYNHIWVQAEHGGRWYDLDGTLPVPFKVKPFRKIMVFSDN